MYIKLFFDLEKNNPFDTMIYREFILSVSKSLIYCEAPLGRPSEKRVAEELEEIKKKNINKNQGSNSETVSSISLKNKPE